MSKGVSSWQFLIIGLISGCSINNCKVSDELGHTADKCNGVWLPTVGLLTSEPQFNRISTHSVLFHRQAECSGVQPSSVMAFISAPALSNMIRDSWNNNNVSLLFYFFNCKELRYYYFIYIDIFFGAPWEYGTAPLHPKKIKLRKSIKKIEADNPRQFDCVSVDL